MTIKEKVNLPGEEGEWEPIGYGLQGEPGEACTLTVDEWPGSLNVRMYRRVKDEPIKLLQKFDVVELRDSGKRVVWFGDIRTSKDTLYIGIDTYGTYIHFPLSEVVEIWRDGRIVWASF